MKKLAQAVERSLQETQLGRLRIAMDFEHQMRAQRRIVTCRKGCHHCCYHPVMASILEGIDIYRWMVERHLWSHDLRQAFQEHADQTWGQSPSVWMLSMLPCPLLKDGLCLAYKRRPFVCRITASVGAPEYCHPHRIDAEATEIVPRKPWLEKFEILESRALRRHKLSHTYIPFPLAVLYGESICKEGMDLADVDVRLLAKAVNDG